MRILPFPILPKRFGTSKVPFDSLRVSGKLVEAASRNADELLRDLETSAAGLSEEEAERRLEQYGPNTVAQERRQGRLILLGKALVNPLVVLLSLLAVVSLLTEDYSAAVVMTLMVVLGVVLRFVQEARADSAVAKLKAMISVTATVVRDGQGREVPLSHLVPGDLVKLSAGDMVPADVRLVSCKDLFVIQGSLTGESFPVEKFETPENGKENGKHKSSLELRNVCFLGTSVESGTGNAVVVTTGLNTYLGGMASTLASQRVQTSFDKGVTRFTWLMIRFMMVMVPLVFVVNGLTKHDWREAFFFSMAVAVGMTPEMLPMIVTVCLSRGAMAMSRKKVIV